MVRALLLLTVACLGLGAWQYGASSNESLQCQMLDIDRELPYVKANEPIAVQYILDNPTNRSVKIMGMSTCCGLNCKWSGQDTLPLSIPPRSQVPLTLQLTIDSARPFQVRAIFNLYDQGYHELEVKAKGNGAE